MAGRVVEEGGSCNAALCGQSRQSQAVSRTAVAERAPLEARSWWTFAAIMMVMLIAGTIYAFGEFSSVFKEKSGYGYDQLQVTTLALMANLGNYFVVDGGLLICKVGTVTALSFGCAMAFLGYSALWVSVALVPGQLPFGAIAFFCFLYGHGCGFIDSASMTELMSDFPDHKGNVVGCVKAYYGLASATIAIVYEAVFAPTQSSFLLFLGIYSLLMGLVFVPVIFRTRGPVREMTQRVTHKFQALTAGLVCFAIYFLLVSLNSARIQSLPDAGRPLRLAILASAILGASSLFLFTRSSPQNPASAHRAACDGVSSEAGEENEETVPFRAPAVIPVDVSGIEMLGHLNFYMLVVILIIGQGSGLMFLNNAGQILPAFEGHSEVFGVTSFVAMISCFNSVGRLVFGNVSQALLQQVPRTSFLVASLVLMTFAYFLLSVLGVTALWPAAAIVGFAYGGLWGVQPVIVAELFGPTDYGFKYACSAMSALFGSLFFSTLLTGTLFDREATARGESPNCYAPSCFKTAFLTACAFGAPAAMFGVWLVARTRAIYSALA